MNAEKQFQEVSSRAIQPKVKNGALEMPDNRREAAVQAKMLETIQQQEDEDELLQGKFTAQLQEDEDELLQGKFAAQLQEDDEDGLLQGKFVAQMQGDDEEELLQGKFVGQRHPDSGNASVSEGGHDNQSGLTDHVRQGMEEAIGGDFSSVQFVTDSQKAVDVGALAFTQGKTVEFAPGQFKPDTTAGLELIGHELTHVDQQDKGHVEPTLEIGGMPVNDDKSKEAEADDKGREAARLVEQQINA